MTGYDSIVGEDRVKAAREAFERQQKELARWMIDRVLAAYDGGEKKAEFLCGHMTPQTLEKLKKDFVIMGYTVHTIEPPPPVSADSIPNIRMIVTFGCIERENPCSFSRFMEEREFESDRPGKAARTRQVREEGGYGMYRAKL